MSEAIRFRRLTHMWLCVLRAYVRLFPLSNGKTFVVRRLIRPLLGKAKPQLTYRLAGGKEILLSSQDDIGLGTWVHGHFEKTEREWLNEYLRPGDIVCDVGANVGLFTLSMSGAVGPEGRVWAFEPFPGNLVQLHRNLNRNKCENVEVFEVALAENTGCVVFSVGQDPAYGHIESAKDSGKSTRVISVQARSLDEVWSDKNQPRLVLLKIDVEGAEELVLRGARECLETCKPALLIEANSREQLSHLLREVEPLGYVATQPVGFRPWNWLMQPLQVSQVPEGHEVIGRPGI